MKRLLATLAVAAVAAIVACSSSSDSNSNGSGDAFCDDYGAKLGALGCKNGDAKALAQLCAAVSKNETSCKTQYQAVLTCQTKTSKCAAEGVEFGACANETDAYNACKGGADGGADGGTSCEKVAAKAAAAGCSDAAEQKQVCENDLAQAQAKQCSFKYEDYLDCVVANGVVCDKDGKTDAPPACSAQKAAVGECVGTESDAATD